MTVRAILWCGVLSSRPTLWAIDGPLRVPGDPDEPMYDRAAQVNGLELAFRAARVLGARPADIHACVCDDLLPQEFETARLPSTVQGLQRLTHALSRETEDGDALLFIATNHGRKAGLLTSTAADALDDDAQPYLTPAALDACLATLPGRQVIVIAACYAGQFLPLGTRPDRAVLAACPADEPHWVRKADEGACSSFLAELFAAWCGVGLPSSDGLIPRDHLPLDAAFARAAERLAAAGSRSLPVRAGAVSL